MPLRELWWFGAVTNTGALQCLLYPPLFLIFSPSISYSYSSPFPPCRSSSLPHLPIHLTSNFMLFLFLTLSKKLNKNTKIKTKNQHKNAKTKQKNTHTQGHGVRFALANSTLGHGARPAVCSAFYCHRVRQLSLAEMSYPWMTHCE